MAYRRTDKVEERLKKRRQRMIQAAREHFAEQGYSSTTMQQVAKAAGTSIGNLYFYFGNKEELLLAVVDDFTREIGRLIDRTLEILPPGPQQMVGGVYAAMYVTAESGELARLILQSDGAQSLRLRVMNFFTVRLRAFFELHADRVPEKRLDLAASAWEGTIFNALEQHLCAALGSGDILEVAHFVTCFNLRGLGFSVDEAQALVGETEAILKPKLAELAAVATAAED